MPGEVVLDPMAGSGTTLLEAYLAGRRGIGFDIDPLALRIAKAKTCPLHSEHVLATLRRLVTEAQNALREDPSTFQTAFEATFDQETRRFIQYWFSPQAFRALFYLSQSIQDISDKDLRLFFEVALSAIIITKRGGVTMALDLAHTRPHRAKIVFDEDGNEVLRSPMTRITPKRLEVLTKRLHPVLPEFEKRVRNNLNALLTLGKQINPVHVAAGNARALPLTDQSVDLVVTSPPYASNAIDYMRAHKFSLIWLGYPIQALSQHRKRYIGGESNIDAYANSLPPQVLAVLRELQTKDRKKMLAVHRYYTEMKDVLQETWRVLRPGKAAIFVVGTSMIRGVDIQIARCLAAIGKEIGFKIPPIGIRNLDRNRRMLPTGNHHDKTSQIQQRMHQEFVVGFYKPGPGEE